VGVSGLQAPARQLGLFAPEPEDRQAKLASVVDSIRAKYGWDALKRASLLHDETD
jgi:hypothetical protein